MNKTKIYQKVICFVIALMMVMSIIPSSVALAVSNNNPIDVGGSVFVDKTAYKMEDTLDNDFWIQFDIKGTDTIVEPTPLDVVLMLDRSGSMSGSNRLGTLKTAAKNFISKILDNNLDNRIAILTFSDGSNGYTITEFSSDEGTLYDAVDDMGARGDTNTGEAFKKAKNLLDKSNLNNPDAKRALVLFTDGAPAPSGDEVDYAYSKNASVQARNIKNSYPDLPMYCVYWNPNVGSGDTFVLGGEIPQSDVDYVNGKYIEKTWNKELEYRKNWIIWPIWSEDEWYLGIDNSFILNTLLPTFVSESDNLIEASINPTELEEVFDGIAGEILNFATDVTLTDVVEGDNFKLNIGNSDAVQYRNAVSVDNNNNEWVNITHDSSQPIYYNSLAGSNDEIQLHFNEISQPGVEVRFKIQLKEGVYSSESATEEEPDLNTNESAKITFTDAEGTEYNDVDIPILPKVYVPNPIVNGKIVKVDENGNPLEGASFAVDKQGSGTARVAEGPANEGVGKNEFSFTIDTSNSSAYIIKEIIVPAGYVNNDQFNVQLRPDGITLLGNPSNVSVDNNSMSIIVKNAKDTSKWNTVTFEAGANGSISGTTLYEDILDGTAWNTAVTTLPTYEADSGYKFDGWTPTPFATTITEDLVYTANFVKDEDQWNTVTFEAGANGSISGTTLYEDILDGTAWNTAVTTLPTYEADSGYKFDGWTPTPFATTITEDLVYTANFVKDEDQWHTVEFKAGANGSISGTTLYEDILDGTAWNTAVTTLPTYEADSGYKFDGWTPTPFATTITEDLVYTANFVKDEDQWHTVEFKAGANGSISGTTLYEDILDGTAWNTAVTTLPTYEADSGYKFDGWTPTPFATTITEDLVYTANFVKDEDQWHTVEFKAGANGSISGTTLYEDILDGTAWNTAVTTLPTYEADSGYKFDGWTPTPFATTITEDLVYTANFVKDEDQWHTVEFKAGANGSISGTTLYEDILDGTAWNTAVTTLPTYEADSGYKFDGWTPTPFATTITEDLVYTANFVKDSGATVELNIWKQWYDGETQLPQLKSLSTVPSSSRPESITVYLLNEDEERVSTAVVSLDEYGYWFGSFIVPMYDSNNEFIDYSNYTIEEDVPDNYTYEFVNNNYGYGYDGFQLYNIEVIDVPVSKVWDGPVGDEVSIVLLDSDGEATDYTLTLNEDNNWTDSFKLPLYEGGEYWWDFRENDYSDYTIAELDMNGYRTDISGDFYEGFVVINTANAVSYNVNYLEFGTNLPVADSVTKSGIYGTKVTESAIDVEGYVKVAPTSKSLELGEDNNVIDFYYTKILGEVTITVEVVDTNGNQIYKMDYTGATSTSITEDIRPEIPSGYKIISKPELPSVYPEENTTYTFKVRAPNIDDTINIEWHYETGYNTNQYNAEEGPQGIAGTELNEDERQTYIVMGNRTRYTYSRYETVVDVTTRTAIEYEVVEIPDTTSTSGSAITTEIIEKEVIEEVKDTTYKFFYDRNKSSNGGRKKPVIIEDPEVPLADLEKLDHFAYIIGYPEGDIRPLNSITREEVAMIFYRLLTDDSRDSLLSDTNSFTDISSDRWSNRAISTLSNAGILNGYPDGTFKPSEPITRAEFATIAAKFDKLESSSTSKFTDIYGHWAEDYINSSEIKGWINGYLDNTFKPDQNITRAESMTLINNVLERSVLEENIHPDAIFWPDMTSDDWYYEAVMEATNSHNYTINEESGEELWTGMKANKLWP
ncbi:S-layer homology domain-containing protein [Sedimentibacter sp. MB31-C6]|uniref:S-layer homology domain-containing protein n=1 Tax=Sedimentibacter sp. MB31-C6 TaxID=3109366 RepID=UPI002DDDAB28|nr:S-layer homology domain-containing protein [Sedimentibacter sp. MB36-C1]WSI04926.1 S-layer homology domain-containing protein [Sedimentibacter sp. MB36-C1]